MHTCTVATADYLARNGTPIEPPQLLSHNLVTAQFQGATVDWRFKTRDGPCAIEPSGNISSNDAEDQRAAVLAGLGIGHGARALFHRDLKDSRVISILEEFAPDPLPIHAVYASGRRIPRRLHVFIDFLVEMFATEPGLLSG